MKLLKRLLVMMRKKDNNYKSDIQSDDIDSDIIIGSCIDSQHDIIRLVLDHIIITITCNEQYYYTDIIERCTEADLTTKVYNNTLIIAGNSLSYEVLLSKWKYDITIHDDDKSISYNIMKHINNQFTNYRNNKDSYDGIDKSFEFVISDHWSFKKRPDLESTANIDILGFTFNTHSKFNFDETNCIWLYMNNADTKQICTMNAHIYHVCDDKYLIKTSISSFKVFVQGFLTDDSIVTSVQKIIENDLPYYKYIQHVIPYWADSIVDYDNDNIDEDEEKEITMEEFFNAALDEIRN